MSEASPEAAGMATSPGGGAASSSGPPMSERMQALLSRAVEDQLSEQRQLTTALADIRALLVRLPQEVREATASAVGDQGAGVRHDVDGLARELRAGLQALGERLDGLAQRGPAAGEDELRAQLEVRLLAVEAAVTRQSERLEQLAAQDQDELLSRLDALHDRVAALGQGGSDVDVAAEVRSAVEGLGRTLMAGQLTVSEVEDAVRLAVPDVVTGAQADTERRLAAHIDEAVLALAEALLRRRPTRPAHLSSEQSSLPGGWRADVDAPAPALDPDAGSPGDTFAATGPDSAAGSQAETDLHGAAPDAAAPEESIVERLDLGGDEFAELANASDEEPPVASPEPAARQHPQPPAAAGYPIQPARHDDQPKRRPWWRPGD